MSARTGGPGVAQGTIVVPFTLALAPVERLALLDIRGDASYTGVEPQKLRTASGELRTAVRAQRRDGRIDVYCEPGLGSADWSDPVGPDVAGVHEVDMAETAFDITAQGLQLDLRFPLADGREFDLHLHERRTRPPAGFSLLAPFGHGVAHPTVFPFFWLDDFAFVGRHADARLRIGGQRRRVVRAAAPWRMPRYCAAPMAATWNEERTGPAPVVSADSPQVDGTAVTLADVDALPAVAAVVAIGGRRRLAIDLDPRLPALERIGPGEIVTGDLSGTVDGAEIFGGTYQADRRGDQVELEVRIDRPWRPTSPPPAVRALFRLLGFFRTWPTTYHWTATVDLSSAPPTMTSRWSRT
jgi:hypothetical protein